MVCRSKSLVTAAIVRGRRVDYLKRTKQSLWFRSAARSSAAPSAWHSAWLLLLPLSAYHSSATVARLEDDSSNSRKKEEDEEHLKRPVFDLIRDWHIPSTEKPQTTTGATEFWSKIISNAVVRDEDDAQMAQKEKKSTGGGGMDWGGLAANFAKLMGGGKGDEKKNAVADIVMKAREGQAEKSNETVGHETNSLSEIVNLLQKYRPDIEAMVQKYGEGLDFSKVSPAAIFYYLEYEDSRKNPSWKRRMHRFYDGVDIEKVHELNDALNLALLSYVDTVEEIKEGLDKFKYPCELLFAQVDSEPCKPAHFIAVKRDQPASSKELEVVMCVRGTKEFADVITDVLCDTEEFQDGHAHSFILQSGKYLVEKQTETLEQLLEDSGKRILKIYMVGHSLGAGAASIAGILFQDNPKFEVEVVGFGCPALLSKELAEKVSFITTVVNDDDMVPRMSGLAMANLFMNVIELEWFDYCMRDIEESMQELNRRQPIIFNKDILDSVKSAIKPMIEDHFKSSVQSEKMPKQDVNLFPPGKCVHFFRDGVGISGSIVPNSFFQEIDVSRRMIDDHLFHTGYQHTFLALMRQHMGDHHFRFDND